MTKTSQHPTCSIEEILKSYCEVFTDKYQIAKLAYELGYVEGVKDEVIATKSIVK